MNEPTPILSRDMWQEVVECLERNTKPLTAPLNSLRELNGYFLRQSAIAAIREIMPAKRRYTKKDTPAQPNYEDNDPHALL